MKKSSKFWPIWISSKNMKKCLIRLLRYSLVMPKLVLSYQQLVALSSLRWFLVLTESKDSNSPNSNEMWKIRLCTDRKPLTTNNCWCNKLSISRLSGLWQVIFPLSQIPCPKELCPVSTSFLETRWILVRGKHWLRPSSTKESWRKMSMWGIIHRLRIAGVSTTKVDLKISIIMSNNISRLLLRISMNTITAN